MRSVKSVTVRESIPFKALPRNGITSKSSYESQTTDVPYVTSYDSRQTDYLRESDVR